MKEAHLCGWEKLRWDICPHAADDGDDDDDGGSLWHK